MAEDRIQIYCGTGSGRTAAAIGLGIRYACEGKSVFMVRFLKGRTGLNTEFLRRLEPEIKVFTFDRFEGSYSSLSAQEQEEERIHIHNGLNFAKKVLVTDEVDVLILDEFLDLVSMGIVSEAEALALMDAVSDSTIMIMTGTERAPQLWEKASRVTEVRTLKETAQIPEKRYL